MKLINIGFGNMVSANRLIRYKGSKFIAKKQYFPRRFHIRKFAKIYKKQPGGAS